MITKGETELLSQDFCTAGKIWNVILFPMPVGNTAKTCFPRTMFSKYLLRFQIIYTGEISTLELSASRTSLDEKQFSPMLHWHNLYYPSGKHVVRQRSFGTQRESCCSRMWSSLCDAWHTCLLAAWGDEGLLEIGKVSVTAIDMRNTGTKNSFCPKK